MPSLLYVRFLWHIHNFILPAASEVQHLMLFFGAVISIVFEK